MVAIPTNIEDCHGWADCIDGFSWVGKQTDKMHIVPLRAIGAPVHLV